MPQDEPVWKKVAGSQLVEANDEGFIGDVPDECGIYIWKLAVRPLRPFHTTSELVDHIRSRLQTPVGSTNGQLGLFYQINNLTIQGRDLTTNNIDQLTIQADQAGQGRLFRSFMKEFLESLEAFTPALYVGEAQDLRKRVKDHLVGRTGFSDFITKESSLDFSKLDFYFFVSPPFLHVNDSRTREALEYIATMTSLSGFGQRAG